jgi:hypothetical protein
VGVYVPPRWPEAVRPPGSRDFEASAVRWLLDASPPEYRQHDVLRRYPAALAMMARHYARGCVEGARRGYRTARRELAEDVPPPAVDGPSRGVPAGGRQAGGHVPQRRASRAGTARRDLLPEVISTALPSRGPGSCTSRGCTRPPGNITGLEHAMRSKSPRYKRAMAARVPRRMKGPSGRWLVRPARCAAMSTPP